MSEDEETGLTLPEAWPAPPALLPSGEVDVEAVHRWVARNVFGEATADGPQSAQWLESYKAFAPRGLKRLQSDMERDAAHIATSATTPRNKLSVH